MLLRFCVVRGATETELSWRHSQFAMPCLVPSFIYTEEVEFSLEEGGGGGGAGGAGPEESTLADGGRDPGPLSRCLH